MKTLSMTLLLLLPFLLSAQETMTKEQIKEKTDSILVEGNLLFKYERSAWVSTDIAFEKNDIKKDFGGFLVYMTGDTVKTIILNNEKKTCIYELLFLGDFNKPFAENSTKRNLSSNEEKLLKIKDEILNEIIEKKYEVSCPDGFSLNFELIPTKTGYKFYIITGTSQSDVIPFGNDYVFMADNNGKIISWNKFHSRLIPLETKGVSEITHSHLRQNPFISATDICTFMLYGKLCNLNEFSVYSPALSMYFKYILDKNTIEVEKSK